MIAVHVAPLVLVSDSSQTASLSFSRFQFSIFFLYNTLVKSQPLKNTVILTLTQLSINCIQILTITYIDLPI